MEAGNRRRNPRRRCRRPTTIGDETTVNLHEDILIDILISSPSFAKSHLLLQASDSEKRSSFSNHRLLLTNRIDDVPDDVEHLSLRSLIEHQQQLIDSDEVRVDYPGINHDSSVLLVGSHNGLMCIAVDWDDLFLWNPTTRVHARLSAVPINEFIPAFGFAYYKPSDDYKVLRISCMLGGGNYDSAVQIYSRKSNSWKIMEGYNYKNMLPLQGNLSMGSFTLQ